VWGVPGMGKKARIKRLRQELQKQKPKRPVLDPELIECYNRAKAVGIRQGREEMLAVMLEWLSNLEKVQGIGVTLAERLRLNFLDTLGKKGEQGHERNVHVAER
jgi:hypothetical protein